MRRFFRLIHHFIIVIFDFGLVFSSLNYYFRFANFPFRMSLNVIFVHGVLKSKHGTWKWQRIILRWMSTSGQRVFFFTIDCNQQNELNQSSSHTSWKRKGNKNGWKIKKKSKFVRHVNCYASKLWYFIPLPLLCSMLGVKIVPIQMNRESSKQQ